MAIAPSNAVHTFAMRFPIDLLFIARDGRVIKRIVNLPARRVSVALSAPGRWSYVYGRLSDANAPDVVAGAASYAAAPDGIVPWRSRPEIFRKQSLARIPPIAVLPEA